MDLIYHIAIAADWHRAQRHGEYATSTFGRTLEQEGFIHASTAAQVADVANRFYRGVAEDLVVLVIDPARLRSPVRYDPLPDGGEPFPHIYGPVNVDAVLAARPFPPGADGTFTFIG